MGIYIKDRDELYSLVSHIDIEYPRQKDAARGHISETGEPYVEITSRGIARNIDFDINAVKSIVIENVSYQFRSYCAGKSGDTHTLYWRIVPEFDLRDHYVVEKYDDNGPDLDFVFDKRCFADKNWKMYSVYMRLLISDKPEIVGG